MPLPLRFNQNRVRVMSVMPLKADIRQRHVRYVPDAAINFFIL
jgi:hypothetical protein